MPTPTKLARTAFAVLAVALIPNVAAGTGRDDAPPDPRLIGRAVLPALTVAPGPRSGAQVPDANGVDFPIEGQIVEGFSAIVEGDQPGQYLAMPDNGFGSKASAPDFLIRAYTLEPDFKTAGGGSGSVVVHDWIQFRDPYGMIEFPIVNDGQIGRLLTGADIDPESMQRDRNGDLWIGDEFGPWILHFTADGVLLEAPIPLPGGLMSPNNPTLVGAPTQPNSRGIEGMGIAGGRFLYPILEGATVADATVDPDRRLVFEYDTKRGEFTGQRWDYRVDPATAFVSDVAPLSRHELVVVERDGVNPGVQRRVYVVDLRNVATDGSLVKRLVLDLAAVPDPDLVSLPPINDGDIGLGNPFSVVCESVEAIRVLDHHEVLVGCDNNFPNTGRNAGLPDDNELVVVRIPAL